ncbi:hypothetical protein O0I10_009025 [Lichtheimia ornata]|uniref:Uncharacterized protein n=1 Tax=Lichtheimia ornata TaxID=688661 RepID=A0AAD7UYM1_9FUNG|nr:uncharacterized protein O0I10_009025 [Lichtheimia ornata]KAJ8655336.1 hypothetical protein O0I10_009025 [Lichtheimia ornata]
MLINYEDANDFSFETNTYTTILEQRLISWNLSTVSTLSDAIVGNGFVYLQFLIYACTINHPKAPHQSITSSSFSTDILSLFVVTEIPKPTVQA